MSPCFPGSGEEEEQQEEKEEWIDLCCSLKAKMVRLARTWDVFGEKYSNEKKGWPSSCRFLIRSMIFMMWYACLFCLRGSDDRYSEDSGLNYITR